MLLCGRGVDVDSFRSWRTEERIGTLRVALLAALKVDMLKACNAKVQVKVRLVLR